MDKSGAATQIEHLCFNLQKLTSSSNIRCEISGQPFFFADVMFRRAPAVPQSVVQTCIALHVCGLLILFVIIHGLPRQPPVSTQQGPTFSWAGRPFPIKNCGATRLALATEEFGEAPVFLLSARWLCS